LAKQTLFISEFLEQECSSLLPQARGSALVHIHCHHHAVIKPDAELAVLKGMNLDFEVLKSGCCGMAGSFGFEASKYEVSKAIGEQVLLPRVRAAGPDTLILSNGFSCREQVEQMTTRKTLHLAELVAQSLGAPVS
jgi:Fe-S oxidoreductase